MYEHEDRAVQDGTRGKGKSRGPRINGTGIRDAIELITLLTGQRLLCRVNQTVPDVTRTLC